MGTQRLEVILRSGLETGQSGRLPAGLLGRLTVDDRWVNPATDYLVEFDGVAHWVTGSSLLPVQEFLRRQPIRDFWVIYRHPDFLSDPQCKTFGPVPFRFDSVGELQRYLDLQPLTRGTFSVGFISSHQL